MNRYVLALVMGACWTWAMRPAIAAESPAKKPSPPAAVEAKADLASIPGTLPQAWAILIGIDDYAELGGLSCCRQGVRNLRSRLIAAGYPLGNVFVLCDKERPKYLPSQANIQRQLEVVPALANEGDLLLAVFSGRAVEIEGKSYLCPMDARRPAAAPSLVALDLVYRRLAESKAKNKLLVLDVHAGSAAGDAEATDRFLASLGQAPRGLVVLASRAPSQAPLLDAQQQSLFLQLLGKALEGDADRDGGNADGRIALGELDQFLRAGLAAVNPGQTPVMHAAGAEPGQVAAILVGRAPKYAASTSAYPMLEEDPEVAAARLDAIVNVNPQSNEAYKRAQALFASGDFREAAEHCGDAIRRDPGNTWAYILRASCHFASGDVPQAVEDYKSLGIPFPCHVTVPFAPLKLGEAVAATLTLGDKVYLTKAQGEWLWVWSVGNDRSRTGWIHQSQVQSHKPLQMPQQ